MHWPEIANTYESPLPLPIIKTIFSKIKAYRQPFGELYSDTQLPDKYCYSEQMSFVLGLER